MKAWKETVDDKHQVNFLDMSCWCLDWFWWTPSMNMSRVAGHLCCHRSSCICITRILKMSTLILNCMFIGYKSSPQHAYQNSQAPKIFKAPKEVILLFKAHKTTPYHFNNNKNKITNKFELWLSYAEIGIFFIVIFTFNTSFNIVNKHSTTTVGFSAHTK